MARSKSRSRALTISRPSSPKPIIIRTTQVKPAKRKGHGRRGGGGGMRGLTDPRRMGIVTGGFVMGMIDKSGLAIPTLPFLGKAGTIGLGAYFLSDNGKNKLADEVCTAALTIAAYELGSTGHIVGAEGDDGESIFGGV